MNKVAVVILAGTEGNEALGRLANALFTAKEFVEHGDDIRIIFDGAGVTCIPALANPDHRYHTLYNELRDYISGVCSYCADAFQVTQAVKKEALKFADEFEGHPSLRNLLNQGYQVLTF